MRISLWLNLLSLPTSIFQQRKHTVSHPYFFGRSLQGIFILSNYLKTSFGNFTTSAATQATAPADLTDEIEHATGLERAELEAKAKGVDPFHEAWLDAPFGTETRPVEVTSEFEERIVGVPDPDDDSLVWWGVIKEGEPPKQIVEGGEFFVLKRLPSSGGGHH